MRAAGFLLLLLSGCADINAGVAAANSYIAGNARAAASNARAIDDTAASAWADIACAMPYGEVARNGTSNRNFAAAVVELCGPPFGYTLTRVGPGH